MTLSNCISCGRLLLGSFEKQCKDCMAVYLEDSRKVKSYIAQNPRASVMDVCNQTGLPLTRIREMMSGK
jgi:hypothetical protein